MNFKTVSPIVSKNSRLKVVSFRLGVNELIKLVNVLVGLMS